MENQISEWKASTWRIRPTLDMPDLEPEAVQFAVLDKDPITEYRELLKMVRENSPGQSPQGSTLLSPDQMKRVESSALWDKLFKNTGGDQVYLLPSSKKVEDPTTMRTVVLSSNSQAGRKWLTSKVTWQDGKPICWCVPVDAEIGKEVGVELNPTNVIDLEALARTF